VLIEPIMSKSLVENFPCISLYFRFSTFHTKLTSSEVNLHMYIIALPNFVWLSKKISLQSTMAVPCLNKEINYDHVVK